MFNLSSLLELVRLMFPDSTIAQTYQCGERKCLYFINHGWTPYFRSMLYDIKKSDTYVLLFEDKLNNSTFQWRMLLFYFKYNVCFFCLFN